MSNNRYSFSKKSITHLDYKLLYISSAKCEGKWPCNLHTHHFSEILYVTGGSGDFLIEGNRISVKENDFIVINPHVEHTELPGDGAPLEYVSLGIEGICFQFDTITPNVNYGLYSFEQNRISVLDVLKTLIYEAENCEAGYELLCQDLTEILILSILRRQHLALHQSTDTRMSKECGTVKRYIDSNYMENITLDFLANLAHMNKFYLVHSFNKYTGLSPINYLTQKRIQVAMELLQSTNCSIAQIASSVGFSSQSYFSQVFRKNSGITPVQYRKRSARDISPLKKQ